MSRLVRARLWTFLRARCLVFAPLWSAAFLRPSDHELGVLGEELAARYLSSLGWPIEGRGQHIRGIEVDLVCRDRDVVVCVEVKTGWARAGQYRPLDRISPRQLQRQRRAARELARRAGNERKWRVDVCEVLLWPALRSPRIEHLLDAGFRHEREHHYPLRRRQ